VTVGEVVRDVLGQLGPEDRAAVAGVRLACRPRPDARDLARGCYPDQRAAFWGVARELGHQGTVELPDPRPAEGEIVLFLQNLTPLTAARVRVAFGHELGHALGWDEDALRAMGLWIEDGGKRACC
jgi:hypothetical protein